MAILTQYTVSSGGTSPVTYMFLGSPHLSTVASTLGVAAATTDQKESLALTKVDQLVIKGILFHISASYKSGGKYRTVSLPCQVAKIVTALTGLVAEEYNGNEIVSARLARRAVFFE